MIIIFIIVVIGIIGLAFITRWFFSNSIEVSETELKKLGIVIKKHIVIINRVEFVKDEKGEA